MGKVKNEELLLVKEVFNIIIYDEPIIRVSTAHMTFADEEVKLHDIRQEIESQPGEVSFVRDSTLFDQLILERLNRPGTNLYEYIFCCLDRIANAEGKTWNQNVLQREFIDAAKKILQNYLMLSLSAEDLFPTSNLSIPGSRFTIDVSTQDDAMRVAYKLLQLVFWRMPNESFLTILKSLDNSKQVLDNILKCLFRKYDSLNILDPLVCDILDFLQAIVEDPVYSNIFFEIPWAPAIAGLNRSKVTNLIDVKAKYIEEFSFLGLLFKHSLLPDSIKNVQQNHAFVENVATKVKNCKSKGDFQKTIENFNRQYRAYEGKLLKLMKHLIKVNSQETFRFLAACIRGNLDKIRLGSMIQNATLNLYSTKSFSLTFYDVLVELVRPILSKPEMLSKVDRDFFYVLADEFKYIEVDPIKTEVPTNVESKEFGTITKFYYYSLECVRLHFVPIMKEILDSFTEFQRLEERLKSLPASHPIRPMAEKKHKLMEQQLIVYRVIVEDKERIRVTNELLNSFLTMFLDWCGMSYQSQGKMDAEKPAILSYIPSYYLTNTVEFHQIHMNFENSLTTNIPASYFSNFNRLIEMVLCQNLFSNKHHKNKVMELFVFYIAINKEYIYSTIKTETINQLDFMRGLLNYFSEVEFSGEEGAFYSKFRFRSGLMTILDRMWKETFYRDVTKQLKKTEEFNHFVGHIITDLNYCMDEGFQKVPRYKELQLQKASLNDEQLQELSTTKRIIKFSFSMGKDTLRVLRILTEMTPETFDTEDWRTKFAQVINYYAQKLSTKNFKMYKIDNAKKLGLHPLEMISDLVNIYINIAEFDDVCKEICEDERSYSDDLLIDLGKTANKQSLINPQKLLQMENLINKLIEIENSNQVKKKLLEDLPEQYTCSLTAEMMMDPVKLPNSGIIVDRKSIKQHIMLNGTYDPFSRQPLKLEDCVEMPSLKKEITEWYNQKIAQFNLPMKAKVQIKSGAEMDEEDLVYAKDHNDEDKPDVPFFDRFGGQ